MPDAPEKIWAHYEVETDDAQWSEDSSHDAFEDFLHFGEYTRSDIAQARIDELESALEQIAGADIKKARNRTNIRIARAALEKKHG